MFILYVVLFRRQLRNSNVPDVSADETGLTTGHDKDQPVTIPWQYIHAWAVIPPAKSEQPARYVVFGDGVRLSWTELPIVRYPWRDGNSEYRKSAPSGCMR